MDEAKGEVRQLITSEAPLHTTTVEWASRLLENGLSIPAGVGRLVRDELFRATYAGVDWLEEANRSSFKIARDTIKRFDKLSQEALEGLELISGAVTRVIRGSSEAAGEMVSKIAKAV